MTAASIPEILKEAESKMSKALEATRHEFSTVRSGRASPAILDRLHVEAYGAHVPLKQVASVSTPDPRTLMIVAFDRSTVQAIKKAIETSDLGLAPNIDGQNIRLGIPPLNEDRRKELVKVIRKKAEDGKVAVRNVRHKCVDELKGLHTHKTITEDENKRAGEQLQKVTDKFIKEIDGLVAHKEREIMEV